MKNIIKVIIVVLIISIFLFLFLNYNRENQITDENFLIEVSMREDNNIDKIVQNEEKENMLEEVQKDAWYQEQSGYRVIAKLDIPKIKLKTNVLEECDAKSLLVSVGKFWGANPNEIGNFCIAGHNYYKQKNMFYNLKNLNNGDVIYLTDTKNNCLEYQVYNIYKVVPQNVECLSQHTNGKKEITLITCTSDSKKRIIVKAREI